MKNLIYTLIGLMALCGTALGATVESTLSRTAIEEGESVELSVTIKDGSGDVDVSAISDFKIVSSGTSKSFQMINGNVNREEVHKYVLFPVRAGGDLLVPRLEVKVDGEVLYTKPALVRVNKGGQSTEGDSRDVFVSADISADSVYAGQEVIYSFRLHRAVETANARIGEMNFAGIPAKQIDKEKTFTKTVNGRKYEVTQVDFILSPVVPGSYEIPPAQLRADIVRRTSRGFFGFGAADLQPGLYSTKAMRLEVKPLPEYRGEFSGLVGNFNISSRLDRTEVAAGESVTLEVSVEGRGNIMDAPPPKIPQDLSYKIYEDKPEENITLGSEGHQGKKTFRFALVPLAEGVVESPALEYTYFDPSVEKYIKWTGQPVRINVSRGNSSAEGRIVVSPLREKREVEFLHKDILPLKDSAGKARASVMGMGAYALWMILPVILYAAALVVRRFTSGVEGPRQTMLKRADAGLASAGKTGDIRDGAAHLSRALSAAAFAIAGAMGEILTYSEAQAILRARGVDEGLVARTRALMERLDSIRYGGAEDAGLRNMADEAAAIIKELRKYA